MNQSEKSSIKKFTGKKALCWFVGFFLVVFSVNGIMTYFALNSWGGLQTKNAYRKGIHYNDQIAAAEQQKKSGWKISLAHIPTSPDKDRLDAEVIWPENDLPPAQVTALISRHAHDQELTLTKTGRNIYSSPLSLPKAGQWHVTILVNLTDGPTYRLKQKIFIPQTK